MEDDEDSGDTVYSINSINLYGDLQCNNKILSSFGLGICSLTIKRRHELQLHLDSCSDPTVGLSLNIQFELYGSLNILFSLYF